MRRTLETILCLLLLLGPAAAEEEKKKEPFQPAKELTEAEREAAQKKGDELDQRLAALYSQGKYSEALTVARQVLGIRELAFGPEHAVVASSLNSVAVMLDELGAYDEARPLYERALKIREAVLGPEHPRVATSLNNLAMLLMALGAYDEARPLHDRALRIREAAFGPEHAKVAESLNNLAGLLVFQGVYDEARALFERALKIWEKVLGSEHPHVALSLGNLAGLLRNQGAYDEARALQERALEIREKAFGPEHPLVALNLGNLAVLLVTVEAYDEARPLYDRALQIWEKVAGPEHPAVAMVLGNLAGLLKIQGAYDEARLLYQRAMKIEEKTLGPEHPDVATSLCSMGALLLEQGAYDEARPLFERALKIHEKALGPEHPDVVWTRGSLAALLELQGQYEEAGRMFERCLQIVEGQVRRSLASLQPSERSAFRHLLRHYLDEWLSLAPRLGRSGLATTLRIKGSLARVAFAERRIARAAGEDAIARIRELRAAESRLSKLANAPPSFRNKEKKAAWQKAYAQEAAEREKLAVGLQREFAPLRQGLERLDLALPDIQAQLDEDAILVDFLRSNDEYIAWVVRPEGEAKRIELGSADAIEAAAETFVEATADSGATEWRKAGLVLRDLVLSPIAKHLGKEVKTIYVCPDGVLAAVPFASLPSRGNGALIDDYLISTVSMAQDLVPWPDEPEPGQGALLLGGVDYGEAAVGEKEEKTEQAPMDRAPRGLKFLYLPGTKAEAETIKGRLGKDTSLLLAKEATENRVRTQSKGKRVLHLATHGFVRDDLMRGLSRRRKNRKWLGVGMERQLAQGHDPMVLAGLALAGANPRKGGHGDDGILTALDSTLALPEEGPRPSLLSGKSAMYFHSCSTAASSRCARQALKEPDDFRTMRPERGLPIYSCAPELSA